MAFSDPHDVLGVPDGVSLEALDIAYKKRSQELLNGNTVNIEAIKDLELAYEILQYEYGDSDEEETEEVQDEIVEGDTESDEQRILNEEEIVIESQVILRDFIPVNFFRKLSRVRVAFLIILLSLLLFNWPYLTVAIGVGSGAILWNAYKKNDALYALYSNVVIEEAKYQRTMVDLLNMWGEEQTEFGEKCANELNEYLESHLIDDAEIFGIKKRASQLPVKTARDVLKSSAENMMNYGVGEKSVNRIREWAESVKNEFKESPQYHSLVGIKHEAEYALAEEIVQTEVSLRETRTQLEMLDSSLKKNIVVRFWLATMMIASKDTEYFASEELYRQAVSIALRDRKASTSYLQRILKLDYEQASNLIDRMESEGIVGEADDVGKREVLG